MKKKRLDEILLESGKAKSSKKEAFVIVTEGRVTIDGQKAISPAQFVMPDDRVTVRGGDDYVSRGALKLDAALEQFGIDVSGKICADIGAATGGFTEVLLRRGAAKVYAIDTCHGKLAPKIREDNRVIVMERVDVRSL
ncbi:MAG: RNA binding methyltransferase FtsJ like protein, partial [Parcubacteria group bacterium Greene0714_36]